MCTAAIKNEREGTETLPYKVFLDIFGVVKTIYQQLIILP